jgi:hypothetical protein
MVEAGPMPPMMPKQRVAMIGPSDLRGSTVDLEIRAVDESCSVGRQEGDHFGDLGQ